jgi:hypothetical protein
MFVTGLGSEGPGSVALVFASLTCIFASAVACLRPVFKRFSRYVLSNQTRADPLFVTVSKPSLRKRVISILPGAVVLVLATVLLTTSKPPMYLALSRYLRHMGPEVPGVLSTPNWASERMYFATGGLFIPILPGRF